MHTPKTRVYVNHNVQFTLYGDGGGGGGGGGGNLHQLREFFVFQNAKNILISGDINCVLILLKVSQGTILKIWDWVLNIEGKSWAYYNSEMVWEGGRSLEPLRYFLAKMITATLTF